LAVSTGWTLLGAVAVFVAGTEMRIAVEEAGLVGYADYARSTRWRYLPGLR
jgi:hypothetical protein